MSQQDALHVVSNDLWIKVLVPTWIQNWGPTRQIRDFKIAYDNLEVAISCVRSGQGFMLMSRHDSCT